MTLLGALLFTGATVTATGLLLGKHTAPSRKETSDG